MAVCVCSPCSELSVSEVILAKVIDISVTLTTLAALADTSKSEGRAPTVISTVETSDGDKREMSRRHSVAKALNIAKEIKRALQVIMNISDMHYLTRLRQAYALERVFPA